MHFIIYARDKKSVTLEPLEGDEESEHTGLLFTFEMKPVEAKRMRPGDVYSGTGEITSDGENRSLVVGLNKLNWQCRYTFDREHTAQIEMRERLRLDEAELEAAREKSKGDSELLERLKPYRELWAKSWSSPARQRLIEMEVIAALHNMKGIR